jgi:hypothetical protein
LPTFEFSLANVAHTLIVERIPFSESISVAQDRHSIVEFDMRSHHAKSTLRITSKQTIGTLDDRVIGQNPTQFLLDAPKALSDSVPTYENVQKLCEPVSRRARKLEGLRRRKLVLGASQVCANAMSRLILRRYQPL